MATERTVFLIGASGFVGGYVLQLLDQQHPEFRILCLLRNATRARIDTLYSLNRNVEVVHGTLDDRQTISAAAEKADIVINASRSDHLPSVEATFDGLTRRAKETQGTPSFLHISSYDMAGCARSSMQLESLIRPHPGSFAGTTGGQETTTTTKSTDLDLNPSECVPTQPMKVELPWNRSLSDSIDDDINRKILEARTRNEHPLRTFVLFPGLIYGIGKAQRSSSWVSKIVEAASKAGHAGTFGSGEMLQSCVHVRDVASAVMVLMDGSLKGTSRGEQDALFFVTSKYSTTWREINDVLGDLLHLRGIIRGSGSRPFPAEIAEALDSYDQHFFGGERSGKADRLSRLGWKPEWSKKERLRNLLPRILDHGIRSVVPGTPGTPM